MQDCWEEDYQEFMSLSEEKRQEMMAKQMEMMSNEEKKQEAMAGMKAMFDAADANKDGKLDQAEFSVFMNSMVAKANEMNGTSFTATEDKIAKRWAAAEKPDGITHEDMLQFGKQRGEWFKTKMSA